MKKLDQFIFITSLKNTLLVTGSLAGLFMLLNFTDETSRRLTSNYDATEAFWYVLKTLPSTLYEFSPLILALAAITTYASMAKHSELIQIRMLASSATTLIARLTFPFWFFAIATMAIGENIAPALKVAADTERAQLRGKGAAEATTNWFRSGDWTFSADYIDPTDGSMINPVIYQTKGITLTDVITAAKASPADNHWVLTQATVDTFSENAILSTTQDYTFKPATLSPQLLAFLASNAESLTLWQHWQQLYFSMQEGRGDRDLHYKFYSRITYPLLVLNVFLLCIFFSLTSLRQKSIGEVAFTGVALSLVLMIGLDVISGVLSLTKVPILLATLIPLLITMSASAWLTFKRL